MFIYMAVPFPSQTDNQHPLPVRKNGDYHKPYKSEDSIQSMDHDHTSNFEQFNTGHRCQVPLQSVTLPQPL